jgi:predicted ribosomally synthesized peptide with SipW-like signal peptide
MTLRKAAGLLVAAGLMLGLIGAGVSATFSDSATAITNISVGTFGVSINAPGGVQSADHHSVTVTCPQIVASAASQCSALFTITSTGSIPANISVSVTTAPAAPFTALVPSLSKPLLSGVGDTATFTGGLAWPELGTAQLGQSYSVTYTVSATA